MHVLEGAVHCIMRINTVHSKSKYYILNYHENDNIIHSLYLT